MGQCRVLLDCRSTKAEPPEPVESAEPVEPVEPVEPMFLCKIIVIR